MSLSNSSSPLTTLSADYSLNHEASGCSLYHHNDDTTSWHRLGHLLDQLQLVERYTADCRLSSTAISWPVWIVLGDTSSGKSSLLSQLAGIALPSSHQLTTRCPIKLQLRNSRKHKTRYHAMIQIEWQRDDCHQTSFPKFDTIELMVDNNANSNNVEQWGKSVTDAIAQAQQTILDHAKKTLTGSVSRHVVSVQVWQPDSVPVTLWDLPGWVQTTASHEDERLVQDIQDLITDMVRKHIDNALFLVVTPANVDFHNAAVIKLLKEQSQSFVKPLNTLGVLTKPDLVDPGAEQAVLDLLTGKQIVLNNNNNNNNTGNDGDKSWHVVKCRGQAQIDSGISIAQSLKDEDEWFTSHAVYGSKDIANCCGTTALRRKLADWQHSKLREYVPVKIQQLLQQQTILMRELQSLELHKQTLQNPRRWYLQTCQVFLTQLDASLSGKSTVSTNIGVSSLPSASARLHRACQDFGKRLHNTPWAHVRSITEGGHVLVHSTATAVPVKGEVVHVDDLFCCIDYVNEIDRHSEVLFEQVQQPALGPPEWEENDVWSDGSKVYIGRSNHTFDTLRKVPLHKIKSDPTWLKEKMDAHRTEDLACFLNIDVFKSIVREFIEADWRPLCTSLLDDVHNILQSSISHAVQEAFAICNNSVQLRSLVARTCREATQKAWNDAKEQVDAHLLVEMHPYTQDEELMADLAKMRQEKLHSDLNAALKLDQEGVVYDTKALQDIIAGVFAKHQKMSVEDQLAEEMELVLDSYGKIAIKRVLDRTPMLCWQIFRSISAKIQEALWSISDNTIDACVEQSSNVTESLNEVKSDLDSINKALSTLEAIV